MSIPRNELNDIFVHWFDERVEFRKATDFMEDNLTGIYSINYSLDSGVPNGINNPEYQSDIEKLNNWLKTLPETVHVLSFITAMKSLNKYINFGHERHYRSPAQKRGTIFLLYEMFYLMDLINNQINVDKSSSKLTLTTKTLSRKKLFGLTTRY